MTIVCNGVWLEIPTECEWDIQDIRLTLRDGLQLFSQWKVDYEDKGRDVPYVGYNMTEQHTIAFVPILQCAQSLAEAISMVEAALEELALYAARPMAEATDIEQIIYESLA